MPELPRLMLVTDRERCAPRDVVEVVAAAVEGGVELVQFRLQRSAAELRLLSRKMPDTQEAREQLYRKLKELRSDRLPTALRLREVTNGRALLLIHEAVDLVARCEADGVHLRESGLSCAACRQSIGPGKVIGRSIHSIGVARDSERSGVDYLVAGNIFATASHPDRAPRGLDFLRDVCAAVSIPVYAIGGITRANVRQCIAAGAHGVAVIGAIMGADDPALASRELLSALQDSIQSR